VYLVIATALFFRKKYWPLLTAGADLYVDLRPVCAAVTSHRDLGHCDRLDRAAVLSGGHCFG
jgi:hypothetical protein